MQGLIKLFEGQGSVDGGGGLCRCPALRKIVVNLSSKAALTKNYGS